MAECTSLNRNNNLVTQLLLPLVCEISRAVHLALVGLAACRLADEIQVKFYKIKLYIRLFSFNKGTV